MITKSLMERSKSIFLFIFLILISINFVLGEVDSNESTTNTKGDITLSSATDIVVYCVIGAMILLFIIGMIVRVVKNYKFTEHKLNLTFNDSVTYAKNPFKQHCGVEIECLNDHLIKNQFSLEECKNYSFVQGKDGSLSSGGAEFKLLPTNGDLLLRKVTTFCEELKKRNYNVDTSCGLHIHIATPKEVELLKKLYIFYIKYEDYFFDMLPSSRRTNRFCKRFRDKYGIKEIAALKTIDDFGKLYYEKEYDYKTRAESDKWGTDYGYNGFKKRACWINFHSVFFRGTMEVRAHSGTINPVKINNWLMMHLTIRNKLEKMSLRQVTNLKPSKTGFLGFFNKPIQEYISQRWRTFSSDKLEEALENAKEIVKCA